MNRLIDTIYKPCTERESNLETAHYAELCDSAILDDILRLNFRSLGGAEIFDTLYPNPKRRNAGVLDSWHLKLFRYWEFNIGWICQGIDPLTMRPSTWGCIKPNSPRWNEKERKHIKYEHPRGIATEIFCLRVSYAIGAKCAKKAGLLAEQSYLDRIGSIDDLTTEDTGFWQWVKDNPSIKIVLTEGAKKAAAMLSAGYIAIGLPGIYSGYRSKINGVPCVPLLIPQLQVFTHSNREIVFAFDQDTKPKTIAAVKTATTKTARLLQRKGCSVSVMTWDTPVKGVDDLIMAVGEDGLERVWSDRLPLDEWQLASTFSLTKYPAIEVNARYLTDAAIDLPDPVGKIVAIKSAKGTGKTEYLAQQVKPFLDRGQSVLVITHRIQLARALADRFGIDHIEDVRSSETGALLGYSLCIDSLHPKSQAKFNPAAWDESVIVIDECEQVLWHLLNSETCKSNRAAILNTFTELLKNVAQTGGTIYLSDADLSKVSIEYIRNLTERVMPVELIVNTHNPNAGKRTLITYQREGQLLAQAHAAVTRGENILIHCSSQKTKSTWSAQNIETALRSKFPALSALRIDRETVGDRTHPAFGCIANINQVVANYQVVIASPTIETGISLDGGHFDAVYAIANGVQTVDAVCQTIERERSHVPRHICITTKGMQRVGNGGTSIKSLLKSVHKTYEANYRLLSQLDDLAEQDDLRPDHLTTWGCFAARINMGFGDYRGSIIAKLQADGYTVTAFGRPDESQPDDVASAEIETAIKAARVVNYQAEREGILAVANPDDLEYKRLQKLRGKTPCERHQAAKGKLCRRYMTKDITDALILQDDDGWYPQLQLHYYLTVGRDLLAQRDRDRLAKLAPDGRAFKPDFNRSALSLKVTILEAYDISQFFGADRTFTATGLAKWHERVLHYRCAIKDVLGISIGANSTPIQAAQQLLGTLGLQLDYIDRAQIDGVRVRRYAGVNLNADDRATIFGRWLSAGMAQASTRSIDRISKGDGDSPPRA